MPFCHACAAPLLDGARFCHACGQPVLIVACANCGQANPPQAKYCLSCGFPMVWAGQGVPPPNQETPTPTAPPSPFQLQFTEWRTMPMQLREAFLGFVCAAVQADGELDREVFYLDGFERSGFRQEIFEEEAIHWTTALEEWYGREGEEAFGRMEQWLRRRFARMYEHFLVRYARPLLPHPISPSILRYAQADRVLDVSLPNVFSDYLQAQEEREVIYTQAIAIPLKKLRNARETFFFHETGEVPFFFLDKTMLGSGKEGLILTDRAIYWKSPFHNAAKVRYPQLQKLQRLSGGYLEINGIYFNVNTGFNYKLLKLLQRLQDWWVD